MHQFCRQDVFCDDFHSCPSCRTKLSKLTKAVACGIECTSTEYGSTGDGSVVGTLDGIVVGEVEIQRSRATVDLTNIRTAEIEWASIAVLLGLYEEILPDNECTSRRHVTHLEDVTSRGT